MSMNELMNFRTTFLRSIAEAWFDPSFRKDLLRDAKTALKDRFTYIWPWGDVCDLKIVDSNKEFEWINDAWVYSPNLMDALTLSIPLTPRTSDDQSIPDNQQAMALGDYYRQYASLFSDTWGEKPNSSKAEASASLLFHWLSTPVIGPGSDSPVGGFIPTDEEFAAFNVALLGAIATAWKDPSFRTILQIDAAVALNSIRGYKLPWNMRIKIVENTNARWHPPGANPSYWSQGDLDLLQLYFPDQPSEAKSEPLALATYNATGAEFPFTCTC